MATKRWIGGAVPIAQVTTMTAGAGPWVAAETVTVTVNSKDLVTTLSAGAAAAPTNDEVAAMVSAAINAGTKTANLKFTETRNLGGGEIPEFQDFTATVEGSVISLTSRTAGTPFVATCATDSVAGTFVAATPTAADGPHNFNNSDNWDGGAVPVDEDVIRFDQGRVDLKYGLTYMADATLDFEFIRTTDYAGQIGLPEFNPGGYYEYRTRYLEMYDAATLVNTDFVTGDLGGRGGITRMNLGSLGCTNVNIRDIGLIGSGELDLCGGGLIAKLNIGKGEIYLDRPGHESGSVMTAAATEIGNHDFADRETIVHIRDALAGASSASFNILSGIVKIYDGTKAGISNTIQGGEVEVGGDTSLAAYGTINVKAGKLFVNTPGTIDGIYCFTGGTIDFGRLAQAAPTITTFVVYGGGTVRKTGRTAPHTVIGCYEDEINLKE